MGTKFFLFHTLINELIIYLLVISVLYPVLIHHYTFLQGNQKSKATASCYLGLYARKEEDVLEGLIRHKARPIT